MENEVKLEQECSKCHGRQMVDNKFCQVCDGKGTVLTEDGKRVLAFLRDSIRLCEH